MVLTIEVHPPPTGHDESHCAVGVEEWEVAGLVQAAADIRSGA